MKRNEIKVSALVLGSILLCSGMSAFADWDNHQDDHHAVRHSDHYYRNGHWYHHGWFGMEVVEPVPATGVYVETLPPAYAPVVINGTTYYYGDNTYFSRSPEGGYTVVVRPR